MTKTAEAYFYEFRASADTDAAMSLLRSRDALPYLALMAAHLSEGQLIDGHSLAAMIGEDLIGLGATAGEEDGAGRDPDAILRRWTRQGWVHRSIDQESRTVPGTRPATWSRSSRRSCTNERSPPSTTAGGLPAGPFMARWPDGR